MSIQETIKRFDKTLGGPVGPLHFVSGHAEEETKQFIQQEIKKALEEVVPERDTKIQEVDNRYDGVFAEGFNSCIDQIKQNIINYLK